MIPPQHAEFHLWHVKLDEGLYHSGSASLLNAEEMKRARQFKFELHRKRFITARAGLRSILSLYLEVSPENVHIMTTPTGKPFVKDSDLQFNVSHSHERAVYAFSSRLPLGIDLEKIRSRYNEAVAERFFSPEEYAYFIHLAPEQRREQFFKLWTGKEALVKALGEGLRFPLPSFSIPEEGQIKEVNFSHQGQALRGYVEHLRLFPGYQAALATLEKTGQRAYFEWTPAGKKNWCL